MQASYEMTLHFSNKQIPTRQNVIWIPVLRAGGTEAFYPDLGSGFELQ